MRAGCLPLPVPWLGVKSCLQHTASSPSPELGSPLLQRVQLSPVEGTGLLPMERRVVTTTWLLPPFGRKELCFEEVPGGMSRASCPQDLPGRLLIAGRSRCGLDTLLLLGLQLVGS